MILLPNNTRLFMNLHLPSNPDLLLAEVVVVGAGWCDKRMMLPPRYWVLVLDTQNLPSDNRKGERELGGCPARKFSM
jgi:hypothetical protein